MAKGKKGKAPVAPTWQAPSWPQGQQSWGGGWKDNQQRERLTDNRAVGILVDWKHRGGQSFGWIVPTHGVDKSALPDSCTAHGGDVYVHWSDIQDPRPGAVVTFWPTVDKQGLGAEDCQNRAVLRFAVPREEVQKLNLPPVESNPCAAYLTSSTFFPELEEQGVTVRKYLWHSPMTVFEIWGTPNHIMAAAERIKLPSHPTAEVLLSHAMAKSQPPRSVRDISGDELPFVPARFRVGLALRGAEDATRRLADLIGR